MKTRPLRAAAALSAALTTALTPIAASAQTTPSATQYEYRKPAKTLVVNGGASPVQPGGEASGGAQGSPVLGVSSQAVDFGNVATNTTEKRQVVVSNDGDGLLTFTAAPTVTGATEFAAGLTTCGSALAAGTDCLLEPTFSPTTTGTFNGVMTFTTTLAGSPHDITLVGTAFNPVSLASATPPTGRVGQPYTYDFKTLLAVSNEASPDKSLAKWSGTGTLPTGLALDSATGVLSGTPSAANAGASYTVTGTYKNNQGQQVYTIRVGEYALEVVQIAAGGLHTCAVTPSGGVKCWGANNDGQLGDSGSLLKRTPVDVVGLTSGVASITSGNSHTCAVTTAGGLKCWGLNSSGQLGDNSITTRRIPVDVQGLSAGVAKASAGASHTCAVTFSGAAKCWGNGGYGRLGDGSGATRRIPGDVAGMASGVADISAGANHTCATTTSGAAHCWGQGGYRQLGLGTTDNQLTPQLVVGLSSGVLGVYAGTYHSCALTTAGAVMCWGDNTIHGILGDGTTTASATPVAVSGLSSGVSRLVVGGYHNCVVTTGGAAQCWGLNSGQLGDGTLISRKVPTQVHGMLSGVAQLSAGGQHTCAVLETGTAKCWGNNGSGQVGDDTTMNRSTPVNVLP